MEQQHIQGEVASRCPWAGVEGFVREHVQRFIQGGLEEEVTALLERPKSARRPTGAVPVGYRNG